ncbi:Heparanase-like protein 3, partial [Linum grandiflorum]
MQDLVSFSSIIKGVEEEGSVFINGSRRIGSTDFDFICATLDWWPPEKCDYGTCSWGSASLLNLDLSNPILLNAIKAFAPLKIRLGGTLQDKVAYETRGQTCNPTFLKDSSQLFGFSHGCLSMSRWDELNTFFRKAGAAVVFGLNALNGRTVSDRSAKGAWNSSNAEALIRYTVNKGFTVVGWELGNELSGSGVGTSVASDQYASDVTNLHGIVQNVYAGFRRKPLVIAPGGFYDANWLAEFVKRMPKDSLQVVSHHIYNLGPASGTVLYKPVSFRLFALLFLFGLLMLCCNNSRTVLLNGKILAVDKSSGTIPQLEPVLARLSDPITVAPFSIVFVRIANMTVPA